MTCIFLQLQYLRSLLRYRDTVTCCAALLLRILFSWISHPSQIGTGGTFPRAGHRGCRYVLLLLAAGCCLTPSGSPPRP